MAKTRGAAGAATSQVAIEPATQPIVSEGSPSMHATAGVVERPGMNDAGAAAEEAIAQRAYELYQARGGTHGADVDDWLQAERELRGERQQQADRGLSDEPDYPDHRPID